MSTVVYQESANHFTNMDQSINNCQIETIKYFHTLEPDVNGDYNGQLGLTITDPKDPKLYVWSTNPAHDGWNPIALNIQETLPNLAQLNEENNFTKYKQTINGNQITSIKRGTVDPDHTLIGGDGQIYINDNNEKVWISSGGVWLEITGAELDGVAKLATPNDFTNTEQTITGHPIASVKYSSTTPDKDINGYHVPKRLGSLYVMIPDDEAVDKRVRIWSSWEPHAGVFQWAEVAESPFNAKTNIENTFTKTQKYNSTRVADAGKKAYLSTVISNGVNKDPHDYGKNPDHNGQMLLGWREHTPEGGGTPIASDLMVHFGVNNTWLPLNAEPVDVTKFAKLDDINQFTEINQYIGAAAQKRQINTCRVKYDNISPALDTTFPAYKNGEEVVWINPDLGEVSVWKAISTSETFTPTNNVWKMIWSSKDTTVRTNEENIFSKLQYLDTRSDGSEKRPFIVASRGSSVPHAEVTAQVVGQLYLEQYSDTGTGAGKQFRLHFARELGNTSWECVYDSMFETNIANDLASINNELDNVAASAGQNASDITTALAELEELKTEVGGFDGRITHVEEITSEATADIVSLTERTAALEEHNNTVTDVAINGLGQRVGDLESDVQSLDHKVTGDSRKFDKIEGVICDKLGETVFVGRTPFLGLQRGHYDWARVLTSYDFSVESYDETVEAHDTRITTAQAHAQDAHDTIALHDTRITALEGSPEYTLPDTVVQTNKASIMTQGLTLQTKPLVIKDQNFPRLELWMDEEHESNNVKFGSIELNQGQFKLVGKNKSHYVQTSVLVPNAGGPTSTATLISDGCTKFTDLEAFKVSATDDITDHETRIAALEADTGGATGGLSAQDLAETPHVIKGSKVSEGYIVIDRDMPNLAISEVQKYSHFKLLNSSIFYLRLPPISNSPTDSPSYPEGKILTIEKGAAAQSIITSDVTLQDINGAHIGLIEVKSNTEIKIVAMIIDGEPVYRVISERSTDLEAKVESQSSIISTLTDKVNELETRLNNLNIWTLSMNSGEGA